MHRHIWLKMGFITLAHRVCFVYMDACAPHVYTATRGYGSLMARGTGSHVALGISCAIPTAKPHRFKSKW